MINKKRADVLLKTSARFIVRPMRIKDLLLVDILCFKIMYSFLEYAIQHKTGLYLTISKKLH